MSLEFWEKIEKIPHEQKKMFVDILTFLNVVNSDPEDIIPFIQEKTNKYSKYFKKIMDVHNDFRDNAYKIQELNKIKSKARYSKLDNDEMESIFELCTKCVKKLKKEKIPSVKDEKKDDKLEDTFKFDI